MTSQLFLAVVFGLCLLACIFVLVLWLPVLRNGIREENPKYFKVAIGTVVATVGVGVLAANRTAVAMFGDGLWPVLLMIAGVTLLLGKAMWMIGASNGRKPLYIYAMLSACWFLFCLWWFL